MKRPSLRSADEEAEPQECERPAQLVAEPACEAWWVRFQPLCPGAMASFRPQRPRGHRMHPTRLGRLGGGLALPGLQCWHPRPAVIMVSGPQILGFVHFGSACFPELLTCTAARLFPKMVVASLSQTLRALVYGFTQSFPEWCVRDGYPLPGEAGAIGALLPPPRATHHPGGPGSAAAARGAPHNRSPRGARPETGDPMAEGRR